MRVVIVGASGFVGLALTQALRGRHELQLLSRSKPRLALAEHVAWASTDLFSLLSLDENLRPADVAVYLVHSMLPSSELVQGSFEDFDAVAADNFARAAASVGIRRIIYLGGLAPTNGILSRHLKSRREVEIILGSRGATVTNLRAGLILGPGGSSCEMMMKLVQRLPLMLLPRWTETQTQPIDLRDVVRALTLVIEDTAYAGRSIDIGAPNVVTYHEMMELAAKAMGKSPIMLGTRFFSPKLSRLWIATITGASRNLIDPLIDSLAHTMVATKTDDGPLNPKHSIALQDSLDWVVAQTHASLQKTASAVSQRHNQPRKVRSLQRLTAPAGKDALWIGQEYLRWLPRFFRPFIYVMVTEAGDVKFKLTRNGPALLHLRHSIERSEKSRTLFYVMGGLLTRQGTRGRFEFRLLPNGRDVIAALHDYETSLPWPIYRVTQAVLHKWVMKQFNSALSRKHALQNEQELTKPEHS